ncbi:MAG: ABC transporter permease [Chloroflexi bacterium]|nr:ABC transporter permease [Chloroflexota bacterium]
MLVIRDLKTRYKNSVFGVAWSFLQPLGMMMVLTFAFGVVNKGPSTLPHYNVFVLAGYLAWNFFSASIVGGTGSVVSNGALVKKVYFPRILLPVSAVFSNLANYLLALPMFLLVAVVSGHPLALTLLLLPCAIVVQVLLSIGLSFMLSTINVFYRDTQFILDLVMLALFFLTPIWYDISTAQPFHALGRTVDTAVWLRRLNPMASLVNIYQDLMYHGRATDLDFWIRTTITAVLVFVAGYLVFRHYSPRFGEEL